MAKKNKLVADLRAFSKKGEKLTKQGVSETAMLLQSESSSRAAVDEGNLKNSISADIGGLKATVLVGAFYGPFVEFGTGIYSKKGSRAKKIPWTYYKDGKFYTTYGMVAQPFWFPALDVAKRYFNDYFS